MPVARKFQTCFSTSMPAKVKRIKGFSLFYRFFWFVNKQPLTPGDETQIRFSAPAVFKLLGDGNLRKGRKLVKNWKREFDAEKNPRAQILLYEKWRKFSDRKRKRLEEKIKDFFVISGWIMSRSPTTENSAGFIKKVLLWFYYETRLWTCRHRSFAAG